MSVVNRMLKDIDRRNASTVDAPAAEIGPRRISPRRQRTGLAEHYLWLGGVVVAVIATFVLGWRHWHAPVASPDATPAATVAPTPPPVIAAAPVTTPPVAAAQPPAVVIEPPVAAPEIVTPALQLPAPLISPGPTATSIAADKLKLSMKLSALVADQPIEIVKRAAPLVAPGKTTITNTPVRQVATEETLATARAIWNEGARPAAQATLREALAAAESTRDQRAIVLLGREIARLEVADNRPQAALDLLKRLEGQFAADADALALRGNAEQRLGLHADATEAYLAALRLRPGEGKWMLGAAISLAAGGKLDEAQVWVDRARERDAITPTISAYLKQLGINTGR